MAGLLSLGSRQNFSQPPPLLLRERPRLFDSDPVPDLRIARLVVREEAAGPLDRPLVAGFLDAPLDLHDDRLRHLVGHHAADLRLPPPPLFRLRHRCCLFHHFFSASSRARWYVRIRAMSRRITFNRLGFSSWPVAFWSRSFQDASRSCFAFSSSSVVPWLASISRSFFFIGSPSPWSGSRIACGGRSCPPRA